MKPSSCLILDSIFFKVPELSILEGVHLKISPGKTTALIGRNGSGKSTLIKVAAGQIQASSGITVMDGDRIHRKSVNKRFKKIGYLPQDSMLPRDMSVKRLLKSIPTSGRFSEEKMIRKIQDQKIIELSGGERRYLEISIILSFYRKYILLDEPFTGVEPFIIDLIIEKIKREAAKEKGILVTDHMHRYVSQAADEAYLLHNKQCYPLEGDFIEQLKRMEYLK